MVDTQYINIENDTKKVEGNGKKEEGIDLVYHELRITATTVEVVLQ